MRFIFEVTAFFLFAILSSVQRDAPSAFEECRIVKSSDLIDKKAPRFEDYHVVALPLARNPKVDLASNPIAKTYRTVLRQEAAKGPNFAGQYRLAVWGCGSSCAMFAVVNLKTGRVITPERTDRTSGVFFSVDAKEMFSSSQSDSGFFAIRKDSSLLVVVGDLDEDESREGAFYFVLEAERLHLVHSTLVRKDCDKLREKH